MTQRLDVSPVPGSDVQIGLLLATEVSVTCSFTLTPFLRVACSCGSAAEVVLRNRHNHLGGNNDTNHKSFTN